MIAVKCCPKFLSFRFPFSLPHHLLSHNYPTQTPFHLNSFWLFFLPLYPQFFLFFPPLTTHMHMNLIKVSLSRRPPSATGKDLSPLRESVQLAETSQVNLPHLNTPNMSATPFISNHTCCSKTVRLVPLRSDRAQESYHRCNVLVVYSIRCFWA